MSTPLKLAGVTIGRSFWLPWIPPAVTVSLFVFFVVLAKYEPYVQDQSIFGEAGQDWESFPGNWATSVTPLTNDIPWEPFVDQLPILGWENIESLSNYLATVHSYVYQHSTNCVDWEDTLFLDNDEREAGDILRQLLESALQDRYRTNGPAMVLFRAVRSDLGAGQ